MIERSIIPMTHRNDDDRAKASWVRQVGRWLWQGLVNVAAFLLAVLGFLVWLAYEAWLPWPLG
jgi:polyferredoxin